jgi:hypothetical protein
MVLVSSLAAQQILVIDATGAGDYTSFTDAITYLNGLTTMPAGGIQFNVSAGQTFTENPPAITADATETDPVIFQKSGTGANPLIYDESVISDDGVLFCDAAAWITFDSIDLTDPDISNAVSYYAGFYIKDSDNITVKNCTITNYGKYAVYSRYASTNITIQDNDIYFTPEYASTESSIYGINAAYNSAADNVLITGNKVHGLKYASSGVYAIRLGQINGEVSNNFISIDADNNDKIYAIRVDGRANKTLSALHNTIYMGGAATDEGYGIVTFGGDATTTFNIKNNIVVNNRTASAQTVLYIAWDAAAINLDNNVYYCGDTAGNFKGKWLTSIIDDFATWQTTSGLDASSMVKNVTFVDTETGDLHLDASHHGDTELSGAVVNLATDIDGEDRFIPSPYIGADEIATMPLIFGFDVQPLALDFGNVMVGTITDAEELYLSNSGPADITCSLQAPAGFAMLDASGANWVSSITDMVVAAGSADTILVHFEPSQNISYDNDLTITSNDLVNNNLAVALSGSGVLLSPPQNLVGEAGNTEAFLTWQPPSTDETLDSYNLYRDGALITNLADTTYTDSGLTNGTTYEYYVTAVYIDPSGESAPSNSVQVTPEDDSPEIDVQPLTLEFDDVYRGEMSDPLEITISNSGTGDLVINTIIAPADFSLSADNTNWAPTLPGYVVLPNEDLTLWVRFEPLTMQTYNEVLPILSNDDDEPQIDVALEGVCFGVDFDYVPTTMAGVWNGCSEWGDYDNDGDLDLLVTGYGLASPGGSGEIYVYSNDGNDTFTEQFSDLNGTGFSVADWVDYDNDGDLDMFVTGQTAMDVYEARLYTNDNGTFAEVATDIEAVRGGGSDWGDYDNDGDADLLIVGQVYDDVLQGNVPASRIYINNGDGTFTDSNAAIPNLSSSDCAWGDYDNDGDLDIIMAGTYDSFDYRTYILRNDGDNTFTDINAGLLGLRYCSVEWGDLDADGDLDAKICGTVDQGLPSDLKIYSNDGNDTFTDMNVTALGVRQGDCKWGDLDNDGDLDLFVNGIYTNSHWPGYIYLYEGGNEFTFADSLPSLKYADIQFADYDNDNDLDIFCAGRYDYQIYYANIYKNSLSTINTPPVAPTTLDAAVDESAVTLSWDAGSDAETPATGLTYNLRIGTTPGGNEVLSGMSLTDGARTHASWGNMGENLDVTIAELPDGTYYAAVQSVDNSFIGSPFIDEISFVIDTTGAGDTPQMPYVTALVGNYPNPFNPTTSISFSLADEQNVTLAIYNIRGQRVATLVDEQREAGLHTVVWSGRDAAGNPVASGVYFAQMHSGKTTQRHKLLMLK